MINVSKLNGVDQPGFYLGVLTSLREFDRREVEGVLSSLFGWTQREECFYALYLRTQRNVDSLLVLNNVAHFQASAMLGRAVFELCIDAELLTKSSDGDTRMRVYKSVELLRAARSLVKFEDQQCVTDLASERRRYIKDAGPWIEHQAAVLWPGKKLRDIKHWSGLNLAERAKAVDPEMEALYVHSHHQMSWHVHGGIQGTMDAPPEHFPRVCASALSLSVICYSRLLSVIARVMRITTHDEAFEKKMQLALGLPLTETSEEEGRLRGDLGL